MPDNTAATTSTGTAEILGCYLYDWNQDGSPPLRGGTFIADGEEPGKPEAGERVVLYGDGMAVLTRVTAVHRAEADDGWFIDTEYAITGALRVRHAN